MTAGKTVTAERVEVLQSPRAFAGADSRGQTGGHDRAKGSGFTPEGRVMRHRSLPAGRGPAAVADGRWCAAGSEDRAGRLGR